MRPRRTCWQKTGLWWSNHRTKKERGLEPLFVLEEDNGIEPSPFPMPLGSSQLCALHGIFHLIWRTPKESSLQPADLEAAALPIELEILYLVDALGIEPSVP